MNTPTIDEQHLEFLFDKNDVETEKERLIKMTSTGRLPISSNNINVIAREADVPTKTLIQNNSVDADLTLIGFGDHDIQNEGVSVFEGYNQFGNVLFVNSAKEKEIK